jgi:hypothetical protein
MDARKGRRTRDSRVSVPSKIVVRKEYEWNVQEGFEFTFRVMSEDQQECDRLHLGMNKVTSIDQFRTKVERGVNEEGTEL